MDRARVVIIGAGPSGTAAATKLLEIGFKNVALIEAENRIGGRIYTFPFADNVVELGAQWCHGEKDNVVYELASKKNLVEHSKEDLVKFLGIRSNKEVVPEETILRLKTIYENIMALGATELSTYKGSMGKYVTTKFNEALTKPENSDIDRKIAEEMFEHIKKMENSLHASDSLDDLSARDLMEFRYCEGHLWFNWKGKGYIQILRLLMKSTEGNELGILIHRVKLGNRVEKITWGQSGQPIQIKCKNGEIIEADHVIVTVSLGVLKENHMNLFEPELPAKKIRAIETIGFGTINKIYIEFPSQFWPKNWNGFSVLWRKEDLDEIRGTGQKWLEDVMAFNPVTHQPRVLCGWMVSSNARYMETLSKDEVLCGCMYLLRKFLMFEIPAPINIKRTAWSSNENFRGAYSFQSVEAEEANAKHKDLASPLVADSDSDSKEKPIILFAGEATHDHYFSTVHGAIETGWREAKRLAEFYHK